MRIVDVGRADIILFNFTHHAGDFHFSFQHAGGVSNLGALKGFFLRKLAIWELGVTAVEIENVSDREFEYVAEDLEKKWKFDTILFTK